MTPPGTPPEWWPRAPGCSPRAAITTARCVAMWRIISTSWPAISRTIATNLPQASRDFMACINPRTGYGPPYARCPEPGGGGTVNRPVPIWRSGMATRSSRCVWAISQRTTYRQRVSISGATKRCRSARSDANFLSHRHLHDVKAADETIDRVDQPVLIDIDVVDLDRLAFGRGRLWHI